MNSMIKIYICALVATASLHAQQRFSIVNHIGESIDVYIHEYWQGKQWQNIFRVDADNMKTRSEFTHNDYCLVADYMIRSSYEPGNNSWIPISSTGLKAEQMVEVVFPKGTHQKILNVNDVTFYIKKKPSGEYYMDLIPYK